MKAWGLAIKVLLAALLLVMACGIAVIHTGAYPVGANEAHWALTHRLLETARERSVVRAARAVDARLEQLDENALLAAVAGFEDMCAGCHAPPGRAPTTLARGLNPPAPDLSISARERTAAQLYWVTRHGIRMTGMPAWGVTHSDDELWPLVALIQRFPVLGGEGYERLRSAAQAAGVGHDHDHGHDDNGQNVNRVGGHQPSHELGDKPAPDQAHDHDQDHGHRHDAHGH
ncbi:MAG TPA: cytochrome c [Xanthomonadaceae bacterium]|nr:cytochrome c [Xanthomonadaceae bacterium]